MVESMREIVSGKTEHETLFYISSLSADAARQSEAIRSHCGIETATTGAWTCCSATTSAASYRQRAGKLRHAPLTPGKVAKCSAAGSGRVDRAAFGRSVWQRRPVIAAALSAVLKIVRHGMQVAALGQPNAAGLAAVGRADGQQIVADLAPPTTSMPAIKTSSRFCRRKISTNLHYRSYIMQLWDAAELSIQD